MTPEFWCEALPNPLLEGELLLGQTLSGLCNS
jgi:hypothetical protein